MNRLPAVKLATFIGATRLLIGMGVGLVAAFSLLTIYQSGRQAAIEEVQDLAFMVDQALEEPVYFFILGENSAANLERALSVFFHSRPDVRVTILAPSGDPLLTSQSARFQIQTGLDSPEVQSALSDRYGQDIRADAHGRQAIYFATPIDHGSEVYAVLVVSAPFHAAMAGSYATMRWVGLTALIFLAMIAVEGVLSSLFISRPLTSLNQAAARISGGELGARADVNGPREVAQLASTFNEMAGRLQASLESLRAFIANASHELRTPLTSMKLHVGALADGAMREPEVAGRFLAQVDSEIDRLSGMVDGMLDLSQIEGGSLAALPMPIQLDELVGEITAFWRARAHQAGVSLTLESCDCLPRVKGDPYRLRQMMDTLLENAIRFTPPAGEVRVALRCNSSGQMVRIEISDTGCGIAPEHLPHIFDRFYRIDLSERGSQPSGSGLGLAIARSIALAHQGRIGVESTPLKGSLFWVELPAI